MLALLFRTIEAFKLADLIILLTKGGNDTLTVSYHLIRIANEQNKMIIDALQDKVAGPLQFAARECCGEVWHDGSQYSHQHKAR